LVTQEQSNDTEALENTQWSDVLDGDPDMDNESIFLSGVENTDDLIGSDARGELSDMLSAVTVVKITVGRD
jgi:hypothetical protein